MNKIHLRLAHKNDISALVELENISFTTDQLAHHHFSYHINSSSSDILLAEIENKIVGCALVLYRKNSKKARLYSLSVHPDQRQQGIAQQLCQALENLVKQRECEKIILEVMEGNLAAIQFYLKNGYQTFGKEEHYYADGSHALRMQKRIKID